LRNHEGLSKEPNIFSSRIPEEYKLVRNYPPNLQLFCHSTGLSEHPTKARLSLISVTLINCFKPKTIKIDFDSNIKYSVSKAVDILFNSYSSGNAWQLGKVRLKLAASYLMSKPWLIFGILSMVRDTSLCLAYRPNWKAHVRTSTSCPSEYLVNTSGASVLLAYNLLITVHVMINKILSQWVTIWSPLKKKHRHTIRVCPGVSSITGMINRFYTND
jgi:hypothetical protein